MSFHKYLLVIYPDFVRHKKREQFGLLITNRVVSDSVYYVTKAIYRQQNPVLVFFCETT